MFELLGGVSLRVLFVDDESRILQQGRMFLERKDDRLFIDTAESGEEGLNLMDRNDFDCIVSDYQMPGMDGLEFLRVVREDRNCDVPFIVFTGKGREDVAMDALNLGADRYLQKGSDPKTQYGVLAQAIVDEVNHWRGNKDLEKYEQMIETVDFPIMFQDLEGKYRLINDAVSDYLEEPKENLIGKSEEDFMEVKSSEIIENKKDKVMGSEESLTYKVRVLVKDEEYYFETRRYPFYDRNGRLKGSVAFCHDITERHRLKEENG